MFPKSFENKLPEQSRSFCLPVQSTVRHVSDTTSVGSYIAFLVSLLVIIGCAHDEGPSSVGRDLHLTTVSIKVFASSKS